MEKSDAIDEMRSRLGNFGVWLAGAPTLRHLSWSAEAELATRVEELGFGSLWVGEGLTDSREVFAHLGLLLSATNRLVVGSGVARATNREPETARAGVDTLAEAHPGRVIFGLGPGIDPAPNTPDPTAPRVGPVGRMREYLDRMATAGGTPEPAVPAPIVLAALGPNMLRLAADASDGSHPFSVPVEHTELARNLLGPDKLLLPEQAVIDEEHADVARTVIRNLAGPSRPDSPYERNLRRLGYTTEDFADGGSDRMIDARYAFGDDRAVATRLRDHLDAGADSVLIFVMATDVRRAVDRLERLAGHLR